MYPSRYARHFVAQFVLGVVGHRERPCPRVVRAIEDFHRRGELGPPEGVEDALVGGDQEDTADIEQHGLRRGRKRFRHDRKTIGGPEPGWYR